MKPKITQVDRHSIRCTHQTLAPYICIVDDVVLSSDDSKPLESCWLFTDNETNVEKLYGSENNSPFVKDAFHRFIIEGSYNQVADNPLI